MPQEQVVRALHEVTGYINGVDRAEEAENARYTQQERTVEDEPEQKPELYPCPDVIWQGAFSDVAAHLGQTSWEIWLGTAVALGAIAHRNIAAKYYGDLFGPFYGLLVNPTGTGKSLCTNTCRSLLPSWYTWRTGVQSGPGLAPILAVITRDKAGKVVHVEPRPAALIVSEWSVLAKNLKIQHATLMEDLNSIFDGMPQWSVSRSDRSGGGDLVISNPTLSVCATTTRTLFQDEVTLRMMQSGFINRYLVLPGQRRRWKFYDPEAARIDFSGLSTITQRFTPAHTFGHGQTVWDLYTNDALELLQAWARPLFEDSLMADEGAESQAFKRLHVYAHKIAMLYAWSERVPLITPAHVEAARVVIETSAKFLRELLSGGEIEVPASVKYELSAKEKIAEKIKRQSGSVDLRKLSQDFRKSMKSADIRRWADELLAEGRITRIDNRWLRYVTD